jgi:hypothetical protein
MLVKLIVLIIVIFLLKIANQFSYLLFYIDLKHGLLHSVNNIKYFEMEERK